MTAAANIHSAAERAFLRRQHRLANDLSARARATSQTISSLSQERASAVRDLADAQVELRETAAPMRGWATPDRRTAAVEQVRIHIADLESHISALDIERDRLKKIQAAVERDARQQAEVFHQLRATVVRAIEIHLYDELWGSS